MPAPINKTSHKSDKRESFDDYNITNIINNISKYQSIIHFLNNNKRTIKENNIAFFKAILDGDGKLKIQKNSDMMTFRITGKTISTPKQPIYYKPDELKGFLIEVMSKLPEFNELIYEINSNQRGGKKQGYKSTKTKVSVIINKKAFVRTVYTNAKNVSYIRVNNQYKLLSKFVK